MSGALTSPFPIRYLLTSILYVGGFLYSQQSAPSRHAITRYVLFVVPLSLTKSVGRFMMAHGLDAGYCVYDVGRGACYLLFPSVIYIALKRDSQYWTEDITKVRARASERMNKRMNKRRGSEKEALLHPAVPSCCLVLLQLCPCARSLARSLAREGAQRKRRCFHPAFPSCLVLLQLCP